MNKRINRTTSAREGSANTWITIFLIVIAVHVIVILCVGGFRLLKGNKEISKDNGGEPARELKIPEEDYKLSLPPEKSDSLEQILNSLEKYQSLSETGDKDDAAALPPDYNSLVAPQDPPSDLTAASEPFAVGQPAAEIQPKPAKPVDSPQSNGNYYIVVEGDTLRKIAAKTGVSTDEIRKKNHIDKDIVKIGQKLIIPGKSTDKPLVSAPKAQNNPKKPVPGVAFSSKPSATSSGTYKVYRVGKGDTLNKIATLFHTTPENLAKINNIGDPRKLKAGMEIKVPKE